MSSFSVSGLASGIDTTSLISQLMAVAAQPQTALQSQLTNENAVISAYQAINTKVSAVQTAAQALTDSSAWSAATATSSDSSVVATANSSAQANSSATFDVTQIAQAQTSTFTTSSGGIVISGTPPTFTVSTGGTSTAVTATSGSATAVAAAINAAGIGVRASVVNTDSGPVLQLTSTSTGSAGAFTVAGLDSTQNNVIAAQDAQISVGNPSSGGYTVSSSTNTFSNVVPGVTFTVSKPTTGVTLSMNSDTSSMSSKIQALVNAVNASNTEINNDTAQGATLSGDQLPSQLRQSLLSVVSQGVNGQSLSSYGISMDSSGTLTFDSSAFTAAYNANPNATQTAITAFAQNYNTVATQATDTSTGSLTLAINQDESVASSYSSQISDWTTRLADMQSSMTAKYAAMETALSKLQSQSSWLTSALASMSSSTSS